ncbi:MAG: gliding motility protein GldC [Ignavibacteriales bacterium]
MAQQSEIKFRITLDEAKIPEKLEWNATDSESGKFSECKTMMLTLWDAEERATMSIDLWTKDMMIDDMNILFHQTLLKLADTYNRATNNFEVSEMFRKFADEFALKLELIPNPQIKTTEKEL